MKIEETIEKLAKCVECDCDGCQFQELLYDKDSKKRCYEMLMSEVVEELDDIKNEFYFERKKAMCESMTQAVDMAQDYLKRDLTNPFVIAYIDKCFDEMKGAWE